MYKEVFGDLIDLSFRGEFDVVTHGCNCFCTMGAGIAPLMADAFGCDYFKMEGEEYKGDMNKLGCIDYSLVHLHEDSKRFSTLPGRGDKIKHSLYVVNSYSQYRYGRNHHDGDSQPLDYEALTLCLRKINKTFPGKRVGLPQIGCGLAGGDWGTVRKIIQKELKDCLVTVVIFKR